MKTQTLFPDLNFKLAIIQSLRKANLLLPFDKDAFWRITFGEPYDDFEEYAYRSVPEVKEYYQNLELSTELLSKITQISWRAPEDIIFDINSQWDGEDNEFEISSLKGIEHCTNLEKLTITLGLDPMPWEIKQMGLKKTYVSLKPLKKLTKLREIKLEGFVRDIEALLEMPSLQTLKIDPYCEIWEVEKNKLDYEDFKKAIQNKGIVWV